MNVDCKWMEDHMEALFCERLTSAEDRLVRSHMENCFHCREKASDLRAIDPLVRQVFRQDLALSRIPRQKRSPILIGAAGTALATAAILIMVRFQTPAAVPPVDPPAIAASAPDQVPVPKAPANGIGGERAKPETPTTASPALSAPEEPVPGGATAPEFLVSDLAGYSRTLNDYRGYVLIVGVWSTEQPQSVASLEQIYRAVSINTKLRVLGVSQKREAKPANTTFPTAFNQGSTLVGAGLGQFVVVDGSGTVVLRGNLLDEPVKVVAAVRAALEPLGIHIR